MSISVITNLSADNYRLKTLKLLVASLSKQSNKDFELVIVNHDHDSNIEMIKEYIGEQDYPVLLYYLNRPLQSGYDLNGSRNCGHQVANRPWHLVVDCDLVFPSHFIQSVYDNLGSDKYPGYKLDIFTFLHCSTLGQSNSARLQTENNNFVSEEDLDKISLDTVFTRAENFISRVRKAVPGHSHRNIDMFVHYPCIKESTVDEISNYWGHPISRIEYKYRPDEMFFICHCDLMKAIGFWPIHFSLQNRGPDKIVMANILYYLHDRGICTLHTITDTYVVHIEHPRPYLMQNNWNAEIVCELVKSHKYLKPIVNRVNDMWLTEKDEWDKESQKS